MAKRKTLPPILETFPVVYNDQVSRHGRGLLMRSATGWFWQCDCRRVGGPVATSEQAKEAWNTHCAKAAAWSDKYRSMPDFGLDEDLAASAFEPYE